MSCKNPWKCVTCGVCVCAEFRQQLTKVEQLAARVPALVINDLVKMHVGRAQDAHAKLQDEFQRTLDEINQKQVWATSLISDFLVCVCVCVCEREREREAHTCKKTVSIISCFSSFSYNILPSPTRVVLCPSFKISKTFQIRSSMLNYICIAQRLGKSVSQAKNG